MIYKDLVEQASLLVKIKTTYETASSEVEIYDVMGIMVAQTSSSVFNGKTGTSDSLRIDISNLPPGVYFVKIAGSYGASSIVEKFVKY